MILNLYTNIDSESYTLASFLGQICLLSAGIGANFDFTNQEIIFFCFEMPIIRTLAFSLSKKNIFIFVIISVMFLLLVLIKALFMQIMSVDTPGTNWCITICIWNCCRNEWLVKKLNFLVVFFRPIHSSCFWLLPSYNAPL